MSERNSNSNPNRNRKNRGRGRGNNPKAAESDSPKRGGGSKNRRREQKVDPVEFWGDPATLPEPLTHITPVPDVKAVVSSLGRPPISGQETAAEHWFSLVYERAAVLAGALAAAGGLDEPEQTGP